MGFSACKAYRQGPQAACRAKVQMNSSVRQPQLEGLLAMVATKVWETWALEGGIGLLVMREREVESQN